MTDQRTFKIAAIPADGVGKEVVAAGRRVLDALAAHSNGTFAFDWNEFPWGSDYYAQTGRMMAEDGLETLKDYDAIYFGAVGWPTVPDHVTLWGLRLNITQNFDQWANVRPVHFHPGVVSPLRKADDTHLDWVVVRENSEGEYAGLGGRNLSARGPGNEVALQTALFTEKGCERIIRFAFDLARTRRVKKVSSVTKSNAQQYGMVLWDETFARVAQDYPDVAPESVLVDAMSAKFVLKPEDLSVVVASNLNADILSDLGSALAGSLGLAASANYNPERRFPSMFEPVHGSAPDIAGQGVANPIGTILSGALMLEHFGLTDEAARLQKAVDATTGSGVLTRDIGGTATPTRSSPRSSRTWALEPGTPGPGSPEPGPADPPGGTAVRCRPLPHGLRHVDHAWRAARARTPDNEVGTMASTTAVNRPDNAEPVAKPKWYRQLYFWVIVAIIAGVLVGWLAPGFGKAMEPIGTTFVTAMRMLIGPIVFLTIIGGIAGVADLKKVGVTGVKALVYFQLGTLLALAFGLLAINLIPVGEGVNADASQIEVSETVGGLIEKGENQQWWQFLTHIIPSRWSPRSSRATSCRSSSWPSSSASRSTPSARSPPRCWTWCSAAPRSSSRSCPTS